MFHSLITNTCNLTCKHYYPHHSCYHSYNYLFASISGKKDCHFGYLSKTQMKIQKRKKDWEMPSCSEVFGFSVEFCYFPYTNSPWPHRPELVEPLLPMGELMCIKVKKSCLPLQSILSNKLSATPQGLPLRVILS